jgi:ribonuclease J
MNPSSQPRYNSRTIDRYLPTDTLVFALGGLGEIGKNTYCFQCQNEIILVDAGMMFPDDDLLGVDYVIPDYTYLIRNQEKIKGLFITHGHEDHIGGIPYLLKVCALQDIYAAPFAAALIEKKLEEHHLTGKVKIHVINADSRFDSKYFHLAFFNVIHSIPDSLGVMIRTPNGWIMTTGDYKFDLTPIATNADYQKIADLGTFGIDLLMADSTNSEIPGFSISEKKVAQSIIDIMEKTRGRLIIATFSSNVNRIQQIITAARTYGRKVCVIGRSMETVVQIARDLGHIKAQDGDFIDTQAMNSYPANKLCILCTGSQGEPMAALSRMANGSHRFVTIIPGDTIVFSSNPIPGNASSVNEVVNSLTRLGATVLTNSMLDSLHTTGHARQEEQKLLMQLAKPHYFMPMHGEYRMLRMQADTAVDVGIPPENIFICANGDILVLRDHEVFLCSSARVQTDDIYIDGTDSSGIATAVLKDRQVLSSNGLVAVIVAIDSRTNAILCRPAIVSRGFIYIRDNQPLIKEAEILVYNALKKKMASKTTFGELKNTIRDTLEPYLYSKTHRNPIVIPVILNNKDATAAIARRQS